MHTKIQTVVNCVASADISHGKPPTPTNTLPVCLSDISKEMFWCRARSSLTRSSIYHLFDQRPLYVTRFKPFLPSSHFSLRCLSITITIIIVIVTLLLVMTKLIFRTGREVFLSVGADQEVRFIYNN